MEIKNVLKYLFLILIFCALTSCTNLKMTIATNNYTYGTKIFNENLGISATYFGDMKFENDISKRFKHIKKIINDDSFLSDKTIITYSKTVSSPNYETLLLYTTKKDILRDGLIKNDTINNLAIYKKSNENKSLYLVLKSINSKSNKTIIADGKTIFNSITLDNVELEKTTYFDIFNSVKDLENYLIAIDKIKNAPLLQNNEQKFNQFQFLATLNSFISNNKTYDSLIKKNEKRSVEIYQPKIDSLLSNANTSYNNSNNSLDQIIDIVKDEKVVMLNENHWYPKHRIFAMNLLIRLKEKGFNYLAIEAIYPNKDFIINSTGFPTQDSGYYIREPYFAHLIRIAKKLDFKIIEYDNMEGIVDREIAQATNLKKIIEKDKTAKIFVYAGIDHILESNSSKKRMAEYFKEFSGINPITFNQTKVLAKTKNEIVVFPSSFLNGFNNLKNNVDYYIINNISPTLAFTYPNDEFKNFNLKIKKLQNHNKENILIKIFNEVEYKKVKNNAIPILILSEITTSAQINLNLPKGKYFIKVLTDSDNKLFNDYINIE